MATPFNTPDATKALAMDVRGVAPADVVPDALILTTSTKAGAVEGDAPVVRVPFISLEGAPGFVAEAAEIPESLPDDTEADIATGKIAVLVPVSREILAQPDAAELLNAAVRKAMTRKANRAYLAQPAPVAPATRPPAGILNQNISDGGALGSNLDGLVDAIAAIEDAGGTATNILASPSAWAAVSKLKVGTGSAQSLVGAGTDAPERQLLSVPVTVDRDVTAGTLVVLDKSAVLSAYGNLLIARSEDFYFSSDSVAIRATWRFGSVVADPDRVVTIDVTA